MLIKMEAQNGLKALGRLHFKIFVKPNASPRPSLYPMYILLCFLPWKDHQLFGKTIKFSRYMILGNTYLSVAK